MRIAVLSDIHANLTALDAVLAALGPVDVVWTLGDIVGYGPDPDAVVARLIAAGAVGVRGNHDAAAATGDDIDWFNPDARRAIEWTRGTIRPRTRDWLAELPARLDEGPFGLVHGSFRDPIWEYVTQVPVARASLAILTGDGRRWGLFGHTHLPSIFRDEEGRIEVIRPAAGSTIHLDGRPVLLNPGSVGQPRDGIPTASYLVLDTDRDEATWQRVAYDIPAVQARMAAVDLPARLIQRLDIGA